MLVLWLWLSDELRKDITVWWGNVSVVVFDSVCDIKSKFLIEVDSIFIVCLHMQVHLWYVLFGTEIKDMVQQLCTCNKSKNSGSLLNHIEFFFSPAHA